MIEPLQYRKVRIKTVDTRRERRDATRDQRRRQGVFACKVKVIEAIGGAG